MFVIVVACCKMYILF